MKTRLDSIQKAIFVCLVMAGLLLSPSLLWAQSSSSSTIVTSGGFLEIAQAEARPAGSSTARLYEEAAESREAAARIWEELGNRVKASQLWGEAAESWARAARLNEDAGYAEAAAFDYQRFHTATEKRDSFMVSVTILSGAGRGGVQNVPLLSPVETITLKVANPRGEAVPGIPVEYQLTIAPPGGGEDLAIVFPNGNESDDNGLVAVNITMGARAGLYQLAFRGGGNLSQSPAYINIQAAAASAARMALFGGNEQVVRVNRQTPQPLSVKVTDAHGNPVAGAAVRFRVVREPEGSLGTQVLAPEALSNENGVASASLIVGNVEGLYLVVAESVGPLEGSPQRFTVSAMHSIPMVTLRDIRFVGTENADFYLGVSGLARGEKYLVTQLGDAVSTAIQNIYRTGRVQDVSASLDQQDDQAYLIFTVEERPRIASVTYEGIKELGEDEARQGVELAAGQYYSEYLVNRARNQILTNYENKGFLSANVEMEASVLDDGQIAVAFRVAEERVVKINRMVFRGNTVFSDWNLNWHMKTGRWRVFDESEYQRDRQKILGRYYDRGYITATMSDARLEFDPQGKLDVIVDFYEGPQFRLGTVEFTGHTAVSSDLLRESFARHLHAGEVFSRDKFAEALDQVRGEFTKLGYMDVMIIPEDYLNYDSAVVSFILRIDQGDILFLESIELSGNTKTRDEVILREIFVQPGQIINGQLLEFSQKRIISLGYFEEGSVQFRLVRGSAPNRRILQVSVIEGKTGQLQFGAGYSSVDKLVGFFTVTKDNFDPLDFWAFTGDGQRVSLSLEGGSRRTSYNLSWSDPWWRDKPVSVGFDLFRTYSEREFTDQEAQGAGAWVGWNLGVFDTFRVGYRFTQTRVENINFFSPESIRREANFDADPANNTDFTRRVSMVSTQWTRDTRNNYRFATAGYRMNLNSDLAASFLGGNVDFWRPIFTTSYYRAMPWNPDHVLAARMEIGTVTNFFKTSSYVPDYERFYLGGPNSVRGYGSRQLAIYSPNGSILSGGGSEFFFNLEYRIMLVENTLSTALFFDGGMVNRKAWRWDPSDMSYGAGAGVRITTPLGPIRLDWAYGLSEPNKNQSELHFSIGEAF